MFETKTKYEKSVTLAIFFEHQKPQKLLLNEFYVTIQINVTSIKIKTWQVNCKTMLFYLIE